MGDEARPLGWYPDPERGGQQRWWTGSKWGNLYRVSPQAEVTTTPTTVIRKTAPNMRQYRRQRLAAFLILFVVAAASAGGGVAGCMAILHSEKSDHSGDAELNCKAAIEQAAAPVSLRFGGLFGLPNASKDGDGYDVSGSGSATIDGTNLRFHYSCTTDSSGSVLTSSSDLPGS